MIWTSYVVATSEADARGIAESPVWCTVDFDLLVQQRAAERLQEQTP
jgi:hypothetical protein